MNFDKIEKQKEHFNSIALNYYKTRQNSNTILYKYKLWDYIFKNSIPAFIFYKVIFLRGRKEVMMH